MLVKQIYLILNIRDIQKTGSVDRCVVNMDPESRREVGGRNKDLELSLIFVFDNKFLCKIPTHN